MIIAGASGLIGRALAAELLSAGDEVRLLVRHEARSSGEIAWNPEQDDLDGDEIRGADVLVSLNGASVGKLPWTPSYQRALRTSRLAPTRLIARTLNELGGDAPKHWISASATGFYGDRPGEELDERSTVGSTFLAGLCADWEAAARVTHEHTIVTHLRTASVLHPEGMLKPMIALTKAMLGGRLGPGGQVWPWISLEDEVRAIRHVIDHRIAGPVNLAGPTRATAADIGAELANELHRPYVVPAPEFALRLALGDATAGSLLLADADVKPRVLEDSGFEFVHPTAQAAIQAALG